MLNRFSRAVAPPRSRAVAVRSRPSIEAAASTLDAGVKPNVKTGADREAATAVGKLIAERAKAAGIERVVFDRGAYIYHGRIKALADAAREGGLQF